MYSLSFIIYLYDVCDISNYQSFCVFSLTFRFDLNPYFFHHFFETKIDYVSKKF